jgi:hypothetical protein
MPPARSARRGSRGGRGAGPGPAPAAPPTPSFVTLCAQEHLPLPADTIGQRDFVDNASARWPSGPAPSDGEVAERCAALVWARASLQTRWAPETWTALPAPLPNLLLSLYPLPPLRPNEHHRPPMERLAEQLSQFDPNASICSRPIIVDASGVSQPPSLAQGTGGIHTARPPSPFASAGALTAQLPPPTAGAAAHPPALAGTGASQPVGPAALSVHHTVPLSGASPAQSSPTATISPSRKRSFMTSSDLCDTVPRELFQALDACGEQTPADRLKFRKAEESNAADLIFDNNTSARCGHHFTLQHHAFAPWNAAGRAKALTVAARSVRINPDGSVDSSYSAVATMQEDHALGLFRDRWTAIAWSGEGELPC